MRLPKHVLPSEQALLTSDGLAEEFWVYSSEVFAWKPLAKSSSLQFNLLKETQIGNSRLLVVDKSNGGVLCNSFVHPDTVLVSRDAKTLAFWVQDHSIEQPSLLPVEVCVKVVFVDEKAAKGFTEAYSRAQQDMAKLHSATAHTWKQEKRKAEPVVAAPTIVKDTRALFNAPALSTPPQQHVEEEEEEEEEEEDENSEDYDDASDDDEEEDDYVQPVSAPKQGMDLVERARLAKEEGTWKCEDCYTSNPKLATLCMACEAPRDKAAAAPVEAAPKFSFAPPPAAAGATANPFSNKPSTANPFAASSFTANPFAAAAASTPSTSTPSMFAPAATSNAAATTPFSFAAAPSTGTPFSFAAAAPQQQASTPFAPKTVEKPATVTQQQASTPFAPKTVEKPVAGDNSPLSSFAGLATSLKEEAPVFTFTASPTLKPKPFSLPLSPKTRLTKFYELHNPNKLSEVPVLLEKYKGKEDDMFAKLEKKYGASSTTFPGSSDAAKGFSLNAPATPPAGANAPTTPSWGAPAIKFGGGGDSTADSTTTPVAFGSKPSAGGSSSLASMFNPNLANVASSPAAANGNNGFAAFSNASSQNGFGAAAKNTTVSWANKQ